MAEVHNTGQEKVAAVYEESAETKPPDSCPDLLRDTSSPSEDAGHVTYASPGDREDSNSVCTTEANCKGSKTEVMNRSQTSPDIPTEGVGKDYLEAVNKSCQDTEEKEVAHSDKNSYEDSVEESSDELKVQELDALSGAKESETGTQKLDSFPPSAVDIVAPNTEVGFGKASGETPPAKPREATANLSEEMSNENGTGPLVTDEVEGKTVPAQLAQVLCSSSPESPGESCASPEPSVTTHCDATVAAPKDEKPSLDVAKESEESSGTKCSLEGGNHVEACSSDGTSVVAQAGSFEDIGVELQPDPGEGSEEATRGFEDDLKKDLDEEEEYCLKEEREQGDGQESNDPSDLQDKVLDFDEDKRNPQYIPKKGAFYQHDDRLVGDGDESEIPEEKNDDDKGGRKSKKLWQDEGIWSHDLYREEEQGPKTTEELISIYGYDIRTETMPPRARRRRRYGRGPNKYQRSWEDEEAYTPRSGSGRGSGTRGGRRPRGGGQVGNPPFRDDDFPDLNTKHSESESCATMHQSKVDPNLPTKPVASKNCDLGTSDSSQQDEWDHVGRNSGVVRRGWGKRASQPPRRLTDTFSKKKEEVKENMPSGQQTSQVVAQSTLKTVESSQNSFANKPRTIRHLLTEQERSKRNVELREKIVQKAELQEDDDAVECSKSSAATVAPRGGPVGGAEVAGKPRRYSSLRQRPLAEAVPYGEAAVGSSQLVNAQAPPPGPSQTQPAILTPAHFQGPYAPYPDEYMLPAQASAVMPPPNQTSPVLAAPTQMTGPFLPPPGGILSFPPQYPPPYTFPAQFAAPTPAAPPPTQQTQAQKPPYYHGDIIYYNTQSQQHKQRPTPPRRPKAAIPIVPPPESHGTVQEGTSEADSSASHQSKSDEEPDDSGVTEQTLQEGQAAQQAVEGL